jgi:hypothetical protein
MPCPGRPAHRRHSAAAEPGRPPPHHLVRPPPHRLLHSHTRQARRPAVLAAYHQDGWAARGDAVSPLVYSGGFAGGVTLVRRGCHVTLAGFGVRVVRFSGLRHVTGWGCGGRSHVTLCCDLEVCGPDSCGAAGGLPWAAGWRGCGSAGGARERSGCHRGAGRGDCGLEGGAGAVVCASGGGAGGAF